MEGRCEESGHCSFVDEVCDSGFRFGNNSGSESAACVLDNSGPDAPDGGEGGPVARIADFTMPCGQTSAVFNASESEATQGESLTKYEWQLLAPGDQVLDSFEGEPSSTVLLDLHRLGGTYESPHINATVYEGESALKFVSIVDSTQDVVPRITTSIELDLGDQTFQPSVLGALSFAVAADDGIETVVGQAMLVDAIGNETLLTQFTLGEGMTGIRADVQAELEQLQPPVQLHFAFSETGRYWIDNVCLRHTDTGEQLIGNGSVEESTLSWVVKKAGAPDVEASSAVIDDQFRKPGAYQLRLRVTDSSGAVSDFAEMPFEVSNCPPTTPGPNP